MPRAAGGGAGLRAMPDLDASSGGEERYFEPYKDAPAAHRYCRRCGEDVPAAEWEEHAGRCLGA
eukprot:gene5108-7707_t